MEAVYNVVTKTKEVDSLGNSYNKWFKIGIAGYTDKDRLCFKIDYMPIKWNGWCYCVDIEDDINDIKNGY